MIEHVLPRPVFVVGASRSGTALTQSLLDNHPDLHIVGETHYFDDLRPRLGGRTPLDEERRLVCEDYFLALTHRPYGHQGDPSRGSLSRDRLRSEVGSIIASIGGSVDATPDAYFEAYCRLAALDAGKHFWGEKTPRHVYRIDDIVGCFPRARIVALARDPRAVVASYRDWRSKGGFDLESDPGHEQALADDERRARLSYHPVMQSMLWRSTVNAALAGRAAHGSAHVYVQRYEDLVEDPDSAARLLFDWLGLDYDEAVLDVPVHNSSFSQFDRHGGVQRDALDRWREKLNSAEIAVIQSVCGKTMQRAGYERESTTQSRNAVPLAYLGLLPAAVRAAAANRGRIASLPRYIWNRVRFLRG